MNRIEKETAKTILQDGTPIVICGKTHVVKPLTLATMIRISEYISDLGVEEIDKEDPLHSVLKVAKDCRPIAYIIATAIVGEKRVYGLRKILLEARKRHLANTIENSCTSKDLFEKLSVILQSMNVGDFFALTTFLLETNMTKKTKVV